VIINMSKVETEDLPANVTVVEPVANSYCITIKLRKISIRITLIKVWNKNLCKRDTFCVLLFGNRYL